MAFSHDYNAAKHRRSRRFAVAATLVLLLVFVPVVRADVTVPGAFGTDTQEDLDRVLEIIASKDQRAMAQLQALGHVVPLKAGTSVRVVETLAFKRRFKIRLVGSATEYWVPSEAITAGSPPASPTPTPSPSALIAPPPMGAVARPRPSPEHRPTPAKPSSASPSVGAGQVVPLENIPEALSKLIYKTPNAVSYTVRVRADHYSVVFRVEQKSGELTEDKKQELQAECQAIWRQLKDSPEAIDGVAFESADGKPVCSF